MSEGVDTNPRLPTGWQHAQVGTLCDVCSGQTPAGIESVSDDGELRWFKVGDMNTPGNEKYMVYGGKQLSVQEADRLGLHVQPAGTIIFPKRGGAIATNKKRILRSPACYDLNTMGIIPPDESLAYVWYWFASINLAGLSNGSNVPQINHKDIEPLIIPLAPVPEQRRIVGKIEELFSDLDAGVAALQRVRANLKRYRAAVLKSAVEGRLTADWRAEHPNVEPAAKLLERILTERRSKWEADQIARFAANGKQPPKGWKDKYAEPAAPDTAELPELPKGWCWASVDQITTNLDGRRIPLKKADRDQRSGPYPYYGASGIIDDIDDYLFHGEYLLVAEDGANLLSRSTPIAFRATGRFWVNNHAHVLQMLAGMPLAYLGAFFNGTDLRFRITGSAQPKLTQAALDSLPVALPPLAEQEGIAQQVEAALSRVRKGFEMLEAASSRASRLRQSILKRAFEGKLVTPTRSSATTNL